METPPQARSITKGHVRMAVAVLLAFHFLLAVGSKVRSSLTYDEPLHLVSGLHYWVYGDYRFHQENGILPQRWAALPAFLAGAELPAPSNIPAWTEAKRWDYCDAALFRVPGQDHFPLLMAGRAMIGLFSVATGLLVFLWSRRLFGLRGAFISLVFFTFSPEFLGHGALVTSDAPAAFFMLASCLLWWRHLHAPGWTGTALSALGFGLACLAKFSAVLLLPMFLLMAAVRMFRAARGARMAMFLRVARTSLAHAVVAAALIWTAYGFRYEMNRPGLPATATPFIAWSELLPALGPVQGAAIQAARAHQILPEAFLYGYTYTVDSAKGRSAFLDGEISDGGWVRFFPMAFGYKSTLGLLAALWLLGTFGIRRLRTDGVSAARAYATPLFVLLTVYGLFALATHLNIGHRHLLPIYPALFVLVGALREIRDRARVVGAALVMMVMSLHAVEGLSATPHHISFFNAMAGGRERADERLVDSSLDWGQGLPGLAAWLKQNRRANEPLTLAYFGKSDPAYYGISATVTDPLPEILLRDGRARMGEYLPGIFAISATALRQPYSIGRGPWTDAKERAYRAYLLREQEMAALLTDPDLGSRLNGPEGRALWQDLRGYDALRANRLYHYLADKAPLARVGGGSIRVYRLTAEDLAAALHAPTPAAWSRRPPVRAERGL